MNIFTVEIEIERLLRPAVNMRRIAKLNATPNIITLSMNSRRHRQVSASLWLLTTFFPNFAIHHGESEPKYEKDWHSIRSGEHFSCGIR